MRLRLGLVGSALLLLAARGVGQEAPGRRDGARNPRAALLPERTIPQNAGFCIHDDSREARDWDMIRDAGVKLVRKDLFWHHVESAQGKYDFGGYDRLLDGLEQRGIRALFILCYNSPVHEKAETSEEGRKAYARYAAEAARRYKGRKVLWELWNEPNVKEFWKGPGDHNSDAFADQYVALVREAVPAMRAADPDCFIMAGATSCLWSMSFKWLDRCFKQGLLQADIDGLSVHPYGFPRPELCIREGYGRLREMMNENGGKDIPILNSEVGYDIGGPFLGPSPDKEQRLHYQAWHFVRQNLVDRMCDVRTTLWYLWKDKEFGVVNPDRGERPTYAAAKTLASELGGFRFVSRVPAGSELDYVLLFEKEDGERKLVAWTTPSGRDETPDKARPHPLRIPVATAAGALTLVDLYGQQTRIAVADGAVTLTLTGSPQYVSLRGKAPAEKKPAVAKGAYSRTSPDTVAAWDARLLARVKEEVGNGKPPRFRWTATGDWADIVEVGGGDVLRVQGAAGTATLAWGAVSLEDRRNIALGVLRKDRGADHALAAFYLLALGEEERAKPHLARAGGAADEVRAAFR